MGDPTAGISRASRGLACQECHKRKIKCNRIFPCERCTRMNLKCVPNSRRPRAKNGAADKELRQRIAKLEALVGAFPGADASNKIEPERSAESPSNTVEAGSTVPAKATGLIASDFWASLSVEVKALADAFDEEDHASDREQEEQSPGGAVSVSSPTESVTSGFDPILCLAGHSVEHMPDLQSVDSTMLDYLFTQYLQYVEPLYNIFHVPKYSQFCNPDIAAHQAVLRVATVMNHSMILHAVRPINVRDAGSPPGIDSPWVMELALNLLRPAAEPWKNHEGGYRTAPWIPWHSMAVILAGLCSIRDTPMANEAWELIHVSMERYCHDVADGKHGMLWKELEKLHKKAILFRNASPTINTELSSQPIPQPELVQASTWDANLIPPLTGTNVAPAITDVNMLEEYDPHLVADVYDVPVADDWLDWEALMRDLDDMKAGQIL